MKFRIVTTQSATVDKKYLNFPNIKYASRTDKTLREGKEDIVTLEISTLEELKQFYEHCKQELIVSFGRRSYKDSDPKDIDGVIEIYDDWRE